MNTKITLLIFVFFIATNTIIKAQFCPPNIDFETGATSNWSYYSGTCCPVAVSPSSALPNRMTITSGTILDPYGLFPIVAPGGGAHSLKLGNDSTNSQAERARYYVHIPTGGTYSLIYRYAVVLSDPAHTASQQPSMTVNAFDSATGTSVPCVNYSYIASGSVPGFISSSSAIGGATVYYKPWTMGNMKFPGLGGHTVAIDFTTNDCGYSGHFGYGYIDMTCGLFTNEIISCGSTTTLSAPDGYASYSWSDSTTLSTLYGSSQIVVISTPTATTTYAVILTPFSGYGCPDTLYTKVVVPSAITGPGIVCTAGTITLSNAVPGGIWSSSSTSIATIGTSSGIVTGISPGIAIVTYTISGGCISSTTVNVISCSTTTVSNKNEIDLIKVFPNPNDGDFNLLILSPFDETVNVTITNSIGEKFDVLKINTNNANKLKLPYPPGIYILSANTFSGKYIQKLIITK